MRSGAPSPPRFASPPPWAGAVAAAGNRSPVLAVLFVVSLLSALAYGGSLRNGFVWDDRTLIVDNPHVRELREAPGYFTDPATLSAEKLLAKTYRPLQTLSFAVDHALWNGWAGGFHLTSLLVHVLTSLMVFVTFREVAGTAPSAVAAIAFSIHPALSEGVLSLAARGGQLSALFGLTATALFLRIRSPFDARHLASLAAFALAVLSKEPGIAVAALLPLCQFATGRPWALGWRSSLALHLPFGLVAAAYLVVRHQVVGAMTVQPWWGGSPWATLALQAKVFAEYFRLLLWPFRLQGRYTVEPLAPFPDLAVAAAATLCVALVALAARDLRRDGARGFVAFGIAWFFLAMLPVSNIVPIPGSMMGERFTTLAFAGLFPLLAAAASRLPGSRLAVPAAVLGTVAAASFLVTDIRRTAVWASDATFFELLARQEPSDPVVQIRAAQEEVLAGRPLSAIGRLRALGRPQGAPEDAALASYWLGRALLLADRPQEARGEFARVAELRGDTSAHLALLAGEAAARSGDLAAARRLLEQASAREPGNSFLWNALGNVEFLAGNLDAAAERYRRALSADPSNGEASRNLAGVDAARARRSGAGQR